MSEFPEKSFVNLGSNEVQKIARTSDSRLKYPPEQKGRILEPGTIFFPGFPDKIFSIPGFPEQKKTTPGIPEGPDLF